MTVSNVERVRGALRQRIITGELQAGEHLNELALSREFGVSRVPVREAIRALESEGLVDSKLYSGSHVSELPAEDATDLFEVREAIEKAIARKAARRAPGADGAGTDGGTAEAAPDWAEARAEITEILAEGDAALAAGRTDLMAGLNMRFHQSVAALAGSPVQALLLRTIAGTIERLYVADAERRPRRSWPEHHTIIEAIDAGDAETAGRLMALHVRRSKRSYFKGLEARVAGSAGSGAEAGSGT
ncbi:GntR family transcriptional regulator [Leucobacter chinensis]|uniref:GntR family transcriptional regulator n=1 Tax=Leucobacter chinensis TaxID=2851010 RepID=UPI00350F1348